MGSRAGPSRRATHSLGQPRVDSTMKRCRRGACQAYGPIGHRCHGTAPRETTVLCFWAGVMLEAPRHEL